MAGQPQATRPTVRRPGLRAFARSTGLFVPYFRLLELRWAMSADKPPARAPDGKPLPSRLAMARIGGTGDWRFFFENGKATAEALVQAARAAGSDPASWKAVFDWGCGCGRLARHMPALTPAHIIGRDIDRYTVRWSARNLAGDFKPCGLAPPLDLRSASIDMTYAFSVLTHLSAPLQAAWFAELGRIMKPGAVAVMTYHDRQHPAMERVAFVSEKDGVSITESAMEGSNLMAAFQDIDTIERAAAPWFELASNTPHHATGFGQSLAVLRRRPT